MKRERDRAVDKPLNPDAQQPICNLNNSLERLGGRRELLCDLLQFYLEDHVNLLKRIETAAESGDPENLIRAAHSIKGLAANFDATRVTESANKVMEATRAGYGRSPWQEIRALAAAAKDLGEELQKQLSNYKSR